LYRFFFISAGSSTYTGYAVNKYSISTLASDKSTTVEVCRYHDRTVFSPNISISQEKKYEKKIVVKIVFIYHDMPQFLLF
jgi:hypothetical protein